MPVDGVHHVVLGILMCRFGGDWHSTYWVFFDMNGVFCKEKPLVNFKDCHVPS